MARAFVRETEGRAFTTAVASFQDANPAATAADFSARITWGDGQTSNGTVAADGHGGFVVEGGHTFAEEGSDQASVQIRGAGGSTATVTTLCQVDDAPLKAAAVPSLQATAGRKVVNAAVAAFTDTDPNGKAGMYTAVIDWGDGRTSSGVVVARPGGGFTVLGSPTYAAAGRFRVWVTVRDAGGSTVKTFLWATVTPPVAPRPKTGGSKKNS